MLNCIKDRLEQALEESVQNQKEAKEDVGRKSEDDCQFFLGEQEGLRFAINLVENARRIEQLLAK